METKPPDRDSREHPLPLRVGSLTCPCGLSVAPLVIGHANTHADHVVLHDTTRNKKAVESAKTWTPRYYMILYGIKRKTHLPHDRCVNCKAN